MQAVPADIVALVAEVTVNELSVFDIISYLPSVAEPAVNVIATKSPTEYPCAVFETVIVVPLCP